MNRKGFTLIELLIVVVVILVIGSIGFGVSYKFISQKTFTGKVTACNEMTAGVYGKRGIPSGAFSFAVDMDVPGEDEVVTFSSEDRKFANVVKGDSIKVRVFKYAPWNFDKAGTYYSGRLLKKFKTE
jgi:prepilin-type N-terminal cleavage/methylation domain-containing protein